MRLVYSVMPFLPPLDMHGTEVDGNGTHYAMRITQAEIHTLVGLTSQNNTFRPYPTLYEGSQKYNGEWTEANEGWFLKHVNRIQGCTPGCIRSGTDWRNAIRPHTNEAAGDPTTSGTVAHARASCAKLVEEYPDFSNAFNRMFFRML
jgi:hypothetical protein